MESIKVEAEHVVKACVQAEDKFKENNPVEPAPKNIDEITFHMGIEDMFYAQNIRMEVNKIKRMAMASQRVVEITSDDFDLIGKHLPTFH